jgi:hypothetical protein
MKWTVPVHSARNTLLQLNGMVGCHFVCMPGSIFSECCSVEDEYDEYEFEITLTEVQHSPK